MGSSLELKLEPNY